MLHFCCRPVDAATGRNGSTRLRLRYARRQIPRDTDQHDHADQNTDEAFTGGGALEAHTQRRQCCPSAPSKPVATPADEGEDTQGEHADEGDREE